MPPRIYKDFVSAIARVFPDLIQESTFILMREICVCLLRWGKKKEKEKKEKKRIALTKGFRQAIG